jgi:hypothetical protein
MSFKVGEVHALMKEHAYFDGETCTAEILCKQEDGFFPSDCRFTCKSMQNNMIFDCWGNYLYTKEDCEQILTQLKQKNTYQSHIEYYSKVLKLMEQKKFDIAEELSIVFTELTPDINDDDIKTIDKMVDLALESRNFELIGKLRKLKFKLNRYVAEKV